MYCLRLDIETCFTVEIHLNNEERKSILIINQIAQGIGAMSRLYIYNLIKRFNLKLFELLF